MSSQWGHGFHQGKSQGKIEGMIVTAVAMAVVAGAKKISEKTGLVDKIKKL